MDNLKSMLETIKEVYQMLEDEDSRDLYMKRLAFFASGDRKYSSDIIASFIKRCPSEPYEFGVGLNTLVRLFSKDRDFVLYGAGKDGARLLPYAISSKRFIGFCSSTKAKQENGYLGFPVMSPEELLARKDLQVIISTKDFQDEIIRILREGGYPQELIVNGSAFYRPDFGEAEQYFGPSFMNFQDEEILVDAGCYDFGSSLAMSKHCKRMKVYAFEPEPENYQQCLRKIAKRNQERISDVKLFPCGAWSETTTLHFETNPNGVSSRICDEDGGNISVSVMPIDEAIDPGDRVTTIKMDIEGAELEALKGARETILRDRPKLAICAYHKLEDLWELPLYIKRLVPEYRLYLRHHCGYNLAETVLYAVMPE